MNKHLIAVIAIIMMGLTSTALAYQNQCQGLFANGLESHKPGVVNFGWAATMDGGQPEINAERVFHSRWNYPCDGRSCTATGEASVSFPSVDLQSHIGDVSGNTRPANDDKKNKKHEGKPEKDKKEKTHSDKHESGRYTSASPAPVSVYVPAFGTVTLPGKGGVTRFSAVDLNAFSDLILVPGDYYIDSLNMGFDTRLISSGPGQLRLFVKNLYVGTKAMLGERQSMPLLKVNSVTIASFGTVNAFIYADGNAEVGNFSVVRGSISASDIYLQAFGRVEYNAAERQKINYGWICDYDQDGIYDGFDDDADNDGFSNATEALAGTDPFSADDVPSDTDGDGVADVEDDDIDNDGYTNAEEEAAGTDPYDSGSFPQPEPPQLILATASGQTLYADRITITGQVLAGDLPLARVTVTDSTGTRLIALNANRYFSVDLSLEEGSNHFLFTAEDEQGNSAEEEIDLTYVVPFRINSITPATGHISAEETVAVSVKLTAVEAQPSVHIDDAPLSLQSQGGDQYVYQGQITLKPGDNALNVRAVAKQRSIQQVLNYRFEPDDASYPAPQITIKAPQAQTRSRHATTSLYAEIASRTGRLTASINGVPATVASLADDLYSVSAAVDLNAGENTITLTVTDALDKQASSSVLVIRDTEAPRLVLNNNWLPAPDINQLAETSVLISGQALADDVSSVSVNGTDLALTQISGGYSFSHSLRIQPQQDVLLSLVAADDLGNKQTQDYYLHSISALSMSWISPNFPVTWFSDRGTGYPFAVRLSGAAGSESYSAYLNPGKVPVTIQKAGDILAGTMPSQLSNGDYTLIVEAVYGSQSQTLQGSITVTNQEDLPLEVVSLLPENQAGGIEPDSPLQVTFNRPVKPQDLSFTVRKTLHGKTYVNADESGADFLHSKGYQLQEVHFSRQPVAGGISLVNNDQTAIFYPQGDLGYNAQIDWEITYADAVVSRQTFDTRGLPTFIEGGVVDSLNQIRADLDVEIEELGITTRTNNDGGYTFGYKAKASENIPDGDYHLLVNKSRSDMTLGSVRVPVSVTGGILNHMAVIRVPNTSSEILPVPVAERVTSLRLANGDLTLDLNGADLNFPHTERSVHAQFVTASQLVRDTMDGLAPLWFYQLQPFGIKPSSAINLSLKLPALMGSYNYLPGGEQGESYALLLGYNPQKNIIEAVGLGKIAGTTLTSALPVNYATLDYIGYSPLLPQMQEAAEQYLNQKISFAELVAKAMLERP
ncbi:hypothetical protein ACQUQU_14150 [Thalassolituus sp. LLYu03]|uniref:hypothetical protein n=1 Tax=Thalassolituus sp. LLYu03 TaxID=3421656 RepID=UPI003D27B188